MTATTRSSRKGAAGSAEESRIPAVAALDERTALKTMAKKRKAKDAEEGGSRAASSASASESGSGSGRDREAIILLIVLYLLQGIPLGLTMGSLPYILKSKLSYAEMATLSLTTYPYSLKLFWSPIVDSIYSKSFGRRKSWIVPMQFLLGFLMLWIGSSIDEMLLQDEIPVYLITTVFTLLVFLCATQDIAVDGWAISLLTDENKTYASTAQTVGLNTGFLLSHSFFLALSSPEFADTYIRSTPSPDKVGLVTLGVFLMFFGAMFLLTTFGLLVFKTYDPPEGAEEDSSIASVYLTIRDILSLGHMKELMVVMMIAKIGWQVNEAVTVLKLVDLGFNKEYLALASFLDFPLQLIFGYYAAKWSGDPKNPLGPWVVGFYLRLACVLYGMLLVFYYPESGIISPFLWFAIVFFNVLSSFAGTLQFVSMGSYFTKISDPAIGGTYMTLLNTASNFGGTWPKYFVILAVDYFTNAPCIGSSTEGLSCGDEKGRNHCQSAGGQCEYISDGYYLVNSLCLAFGVISFFLYIMPVLKRLQGVNDKEWHVQVSTKKKE